MEQATDTMFFRWSGTRWVLRDGKRPARRTVRTTRDEVKRIFTPEVRAGIARDNDYTCTYCRERGTIVKGADGERWTIDHVIPLGRGGSIGMDNAVLSCRTCNLQKGALTPEEWKGTA